MKLKTRIFLWITSLFVGGFIVSYFVQERLTQQNLHEAEKRIHQQILVLENVKRKHFEEFLGQHLTDVECNLKAQLYFFRHNANAFFYSLPAKDPYILPASWLLRNRWVSLIEMEESLIITERLLSPANFYLERSGLLVMNRGDKKYVAIPLTDHKGSSERYYALFDFEKIQDMKIDEGEAPFISIFFDPIHPFPNWQVKRSRELMLAAKKAQRALTGQRQEKKRKIFRAKTEYKSSKEVLKHWQYDQTNMIWSLAALRITGSPFFPDGIVKVDEFGVRALLAENVLFKDKPEVVGKSADGHLEIFLGPEKERFFFGLRELVDGKSITLGIDGYNYLAQIAESIHERVALAVSDHLVAVFDEKGKREKASIWNDLDISTISTKSAGIIRVGHEDQFFLHLSPMRGSDLHFYAFIPKSAALAPIRMLDRETENLLDRISLQMRLVALIVFGVLIVILLNVARRITKPISWLAGATDKISQGELEEINLPELKGRRKNDEVYSLYRGFQSMVEGLKEKERVRGVLNKVVAPEIAKEILSHELHLGGEEREATILFADIRHFTKTTEKMPPQEVIAILNECMTIASQVIDEEGGVIDKFVGDEVMALFGIPTLKEDSPFHAVGCGWKILEAIKQWNEKRRGEGKIEIEMGVGIHKGVVVAGNMGAENRLNYTVVGSNVNLAARLCGDAGPMQLLISEAVYEDASVKEKIECDPVQAHELKGFSTGIPAYSVKSVKGLS